MKKRYTKKQIQEAINYWKKQLKTMNESTNDTRLPVHMIETLKKFARIQRRLGPNATDEEFAEAMDMDIEVIAKLRELITSIKTF